MTPALEQREQTLSRYAASLHDCAFGLLRTAREWKRMNRPDEVARLVKNARWHWQAYKQEKFHA